MRGMCAAMLTFEAIILGLSVPVMIGVSGVDTSVALSLGLSLALIALITAGLLRFPWAYWIGHLLQLVMIGLGVLVPIMFALGALFALFWAAAYFLGRKIEADNVVRARLEEQARAGADHKPGARGGADVRPDL